MRQPAPHCPKDDSVMKAEVVPLPSWLSIKNQKRTRTIYRCRKKGCFMCVCGESAPENKSYNMKRGREFMPDSYFK
jgi:hypothetical protein